MKSKDGESGVGQPLEVGNRAFEETGCCERVGGQRARTKPQ